MFRKESVKIIALWLILGAVNLILYFPMLKGYFYYDDFQFFGAFQDTPSFYNAILIEFRQGYALRFFMDFILWTRFRLFGWNPMPYFAISILQNFIVGILVFIFSQQLFHQKKISFIAALIFTVAFPSIQVVSWITGSTVSLVACFYLGTVILFIQFLATRRTGWYIAALISFALALFTNEYAITLLPMLILIALSLVNKYHTSYTRLAILLAPYFLIMIPYGWYQYQLLSQGTSEGVIGGGYRLGFHMIPAFLNLSHLLVPDLHFPRLVNFLTAYFPPGLPIIQVLSPAAIVLWISITIFILIKGSRRTRMLILWIYLVFAPMTLWVNPDTAHSYRYLYLPMISFSILLALFIDRVASWLSKRKLEWGRLGLVAFVGIWILYSIIPITIFQAQEVAKGQVRRTIIENIRALHPELPTGSHIYIGVPDANYRDLQWGVPEFYPNPISVITIPPSAWPDQRSPGDYFFQYENESLVEKTTP